ncbi:MAG: hypothetical protein KGY61_04890 [Desulfobacterales bacterium]|nr:hypothetical protein [Desulfobacterales bacterium]
MFPWLIAHRGAMVEAPENTRAAFNRALSYPIDGIEFDVQLSRDRVPVVFHDQELKKINGSRRPIASYDYGELCRMDWGAWFAESFAGETVLTLEEVLLAYGTKTRLLVEIKSDGASGSRAMNRFMAQTVPEMIEKDLPKDWIDRIMVLSFDSDMISTAMAKMPNLKYGLNLKTEKFNVTDWAGDLYAVSLPVHRMTPWFVDNCHKNGLVVMTYACNTEKTVDAALDMGIDVVMTDNPGRISAHRERWSK